MPPTSNRELLLDIAEELIRARGYNAFSYHDLAERIGIRTASIHYHFPTKAALAVAVVARYRDRFQSKLDELAATNRGSKRLMRDFMALFEPEGDQSERICLCAVLAAEFLTLPEPVRLEVRSFFTSCEAWLAARLEAARSSGEARLSGKPLSVAKSVVAGLEGALLAARAFNDRSRIEEQAQWLTQAIFPKEA